MKAFLFGFLLILANCAAWEYGKALDQCAFDHVGDPAGRVQCQCDVSKDAGRSCDWLDSGADAGAQDAGAQ